MRIIRKNTAEKVIHNTSKYKKSRLKNLLLYGLPASILFCLIIVAYAATMNGIEVTEDSSAIIKLLKGAELQAPDPIVVLREEVVEHRAELERLYNDNKTRRETVSRSADSGRFPVYDYEKLTAKRDIVYLMEKCAYKLGFKSIDEIYPIVAYESHFNPKLETKTKREHSIGLLMVNTWTNYPKGQDINKLKDAEFNLNYQLPELFVHYGDGRAKGLKEIDLVLYMVRNGQRPDYSNKDVRKYIISESTKYYKEIITAKIR